MHIRGTVVATSLSIAALAVAGATGVSGTAIAAPAASSFSLSGTVTKVAKPQNIVTITVKKKKYSIVVNSTTVITVHGSHASLAKLKVGSTVRVTGEHLGKLYLGLSIHAS